LALDIGGTKLAAAVVDVTGSLHFETRVPTPQTLDGAGLFGVVLDLVDTVDARAKDAALAVDVLGVGCGGPMNETGVSPLNIPAWKTYPLTSRLEETTGKHVVLANDAMALALAEGKWGAAIGRDHFMAMVVSTGIGAGIVIDGSLLYGREGNAGHIGHVIVEPDGRICHCGARGCLEAEASGTAIKEISGGAPKDADTTLKIRCGTLVGRGVASMANCLDFDLCVVAGSVALGYGDIFFDNANEEAQRRAKLSFSRSLSIIPGGLGRTGPLLGAGALGMAGSIRQARGTMPR
jgi:glucokinase